MGHQARDITRDVFDEEADELGVSRFARAMRRKLAEKRLEGYSGWNDDCSIARLEHLLNNHVRKGRAPANLVDIANLCMMLWNRHAPKGKVRRCRAS